MLEDGEENVKDLKLRIVLHKKVREISPERRGRSEKAHLPFAISTFNIVLFMSSGQGRE